MYQMSQCHKMKSVLQSHRHLFKSTDVPLDLDKHDLIFPSLLVEYITLSQAQDLRSWI